MSSGRTINMTGEHLLRNICLFVYPLMISNLCQILFNAADTLIGICGVRLLYIFTVLPHFRTLNMLFFCYPLSWTVTSVILMIMWYVILGRKLMKAA